MSKKKENIETTVLNVNEPEVNENADIVNVEPASPEIKPDEVKDTENKKDSKKEYKLNIEVKFTDKYTGKKYNVGDVITVSKERFEELLNDSRKLVSVNK